MVRLQEFGYQVIDKMFDLEEVEEIIELIESNSKINSNHRNHGGLFAIREFLLEYPDVFAVLRENRRLKDLIRSFGKDYKVIRSIYFDKPPRANWIVNWHQDLTINVKEKIAQPEFKHWRKIENRVLVQPPKSYLERIITIRIHLDNCDRNNGALQVIPKSHKNGIVQITDLGDTEKAKSEYCEVSKGGVMLMKPLLLHHSKRSTSDTRRRRVIHLELSKEHIPLGMELKENFIIE